MSAPLLRMPVLMVDIRVVRVAVRDGRMPMLVGMWFTSIPREIVRVLMVDVVDVAMGVRDWIVRVHVLMALRKMEPDTSRHEDEHYPESPRDLLAEKQNGHSSSDERSR